MRAGCRHLFCSTFSKMWINSLHEKSCTFQRNSLSGKRKTIPALILFHRSVSNFHPVTCDFRLTFTNLFNEWDSGMSAVTKCFVMPSMTNVFSDWSRTCHLSWVKTAEVPGANKTPYLPWETITQLTQVVLLETVANL